MKCQFLKSIHSVLQSWQLLSKVYLWLWIEISLMNSFNVKDMQRYQVSNNTSFYDPPALLLLIMKWVRGKGAKQSLRKFVLNHELHIFYEMKNLNKYHTECIRMAHKWFKRPSVIHFLFLSFNRQLICLPLVIIKGMASSQ